MTPAGWMDESSLDQREPGSHSHCCSLSSGVPTKNKQTLQTPPTSRALQLHIYLCPPSGATAVSRALGRRRCHNPRVNDGDYLKGLSHGIFRPVFLACMNASRPECEPLVVLKFL